jgi:hypothetical protein
MDHPSLYSIDLTVLKDNVSGTDAGNIERKHGVGTGRRTKHGRELRQLSGSGNALAFAAVYNDGDLTLGTQATRGVLATQVPLFGFYYKFFCHNFLEFKVSISKFKIIRSI